MTCSVTEDRTWVRGSIEYLEVQIEADVELNVQAVRFTFDRVTFFDAEWAGDPGTTRTARLLLDDSMLPDAITTPVFVTITDNPETPLIPAGTLTVI